MKKLLHYCGEYILQKKKMTIPSYKNFSHFPILLLLIIFSHINYVYAQVSNQTQIPVPVRVVVDTSSSFGAMVNLCMDMAVSDFYSSHSNYQTRLKLMKKDAKNTLDLNLAVVELLKREEVVAILGTQGSMQEDIAAAVGESALVPIVSFTSRSSSLSYNQSSFIFRTAFDDSVQAEALTAICGRFGWSETVILYEDTESGNQFLSHTIEKFQDADIKLTYMAAIPLLAEDSLIKNKLNLMKDKQTRVFLVHMNSKLGSRLFTLANEAGMMSEGYAWLVTDSISIVLNSISSETRDSMDGVVGIRPYAFPSKSLKSFGERWKRNMLLSKATNPAMDLNIYGLWAYDTVTALAIAVENTKPLDSSFGSRLVSEVSRTRFGGLAGDFELVEGNLKAAEYEIFNIIGDGERRVGFWNTERGITREAREGRDSKPKNELRNIMWPGDSTTQPKGWSIPPTGSLRVGAPCRSNGFKEFVHLVLDPSTNQRHATGFAVDIFLEALKQLPFPLNYTFHCFNDSTAGNVNFDVLIKSKIKEFNIFVGDITIWAPRVEYADFTLPFSESGIVLVVKNKKPFDMWIFIRPLRWDLWLGIFVASILIGIVLCILENKGSDMYWTPISVLAFQDRNMVSNNWSVFVLVCWLFMAFVLMQSFTANLSAILTLDQLKFSFSQEYCVGYHDGSFMRNFLTQTLNINTCMRGYTSVKGFHEAMTNGSKNGGIDAIFDELPYMKLLMNQYKSQYKILGPSYSTGGFGFALPRDSPLTEHFSRAILNVTQGPSMSYIERKNLGAGYSSQDPLSSVISQGTSSLTLREFAGLFLLTGVFVLFALLCSSTSIGRKFTHAMQHFIQRCFSTRTATVHSMELSSFDGDSENNGSATPPPPGESGGASVVEDEAAEVLETTPENESSTDAGEGIENEEPLAPPLNQG